MVIAAFNNYDVFMLSQYTASPHSFNRRNLLWQRKRHSSCSVVYFIVDFLLLADLP